MENNSTYSAMHATTKIPHKYFMAKICLKSNVWGWCDFFWHEHDYLKILIHPSFSQHFHKGRLTSRSQNPVWRINILSWTLSITCFTFFRQNLFSFKINWSNVLFAFVKKKNVLFAFRRVNFFFLTNNMHTCNLISCYYFGNIKWKCHILFSN